MNTVPDDDIAVAELDAAMEEMRQAQETALPRARTTYHRARWNRREANGIAIRIINPDATRC